jgi:hypothetical protein
VNSGGHKTRQKFQLATKCTRNTKSSHSSGNIDLSFVNSVPFVAKKNHKKLSCSVSDGKHCDHHSHLAAVVQEVEAVPVEIKQEAASG